MDIPGRLSSSLITLILLENILLVHWQGMKRLTDIQILIGCNVKIISSLLTKLT